MARLGDIYLVLIIARYSPSQKSGYCEPGLSYRQVPCLFVPPPPPLFPLPKFLFSFFSISSGFARPMERRTRLRKMWEPHAVTL